MLTNTEFPVDPQSLIEVFCEAGYKLSGEYPVICSDEGKIEGEIMEGEQLTPTCEIGRLFDSNLGATKLGRGVFPLKFSNT